MILLFDRRRLVLWLGSGLAAAATVVWLVARSWAPGAASHQRLTLRLVPEEATETFDAATVSERVPVSSWSFADAKDAKGWRVSNIDPGGAFAGRGLRVRVRDADPELRPRVVRAVDFDAGEVDAIEVAAAGPRRDFRERGAIQLYWCGPEEAFGEERSLRLPAVEDVGDYVTTYTFALLTHPRWSGRITRLRIDPSSAPGDTIELRAVQAIKYRLVAERFLAALRRPWKVSLAGDLRGSLLAPPGQPLDRQFVVPPGSTLRFSYGVPLALGAPVRFEVSVQAPGQTRVAAFEGRVNPARAAEAGTWHDGAVDLSSFAGKQVKVSLSTAWKGPVDPARGLPVWSNPEVWTRTSAPPPPNLVVVSLDTLRADHLSLYGYERETTPRLDAWARRRAAVFLDAVAPSPWTLPSHASLFTGLDALRHGVNQGYPVPRSLKMMAERLREAGYATVAVTGGGYLSRDYGFDRGFDSFSAWQGAPGADPTEVTVGIDRSVRWLRALADRPFFLFFHTYEIHAPYRPRPPFYERFGGTPEPPEVRPFPITPRSGDGFLLKQHVLARSRPIADSQLPVLSSLYDAGIAFADEQLGRLLDQFGALGLEGRTAVIVTSDHGEALGERGLGGHAYLYDFNLSIPLILSLPDGRAAGRRISSQVRLVDVQPTLLELAGITGPADADGASLLPLVDDPARVVHRDAWSYAASSNYGIALRSAGRVKYIFNNTAWSPACGREEVYRLDADPGERNDLASGSEEIEGLRERVARAVRTGSTGISVRFSNAGPSAFSGALEAPFLHQVRVKIYERGCPEVSWNERAGRLDYTVPPGRAFTLLLEGVAPGRLRVTAAPSPARPAFEASLEPADLARSWQVRGEGAGWRQGPAGPEDPDTGVAIRWRGDPRLLEPESRAVDPATREQLRALGYVH